MSERRDDPAPIIADLLSFGLRSSGGPGGGTLTNLQEVRDLYGHERDAVAYLRYRKAVGDRPPICAWADQVVEKGWPPRGPFQGTKGWKAPE